MLSKSLGRFTNLRTLFNDGLDSDVAADDKRVRLFARLVVLLPIVPLSEYRNKI